MATIGRRNKKQGHRYRLAQSRARTSRFPPYRGSRRAWEDDLPGGLRLAHGGLEEKVFARLPDETWVYPGHGNDTTVGAERPSIPEWRTRGW